MSVPPPAKPREERPATSPATAWLVENAAFQALNGTIWASMLAALTALAASFAAATTAALAMCLAVPILGWFIGLPFVLCGAMIAAMLWFTALMAILSGWACTAAAFAAVTFARRMLDSSRSRP